MAVRARLAEQPHLLDVGSGGSRAAFFSLGRHNTKGKSRAAWMDISSTTGPQLLNSFKYFAWCQLCVWHKLVQQSTRYSILEY